MWRFTARAVTLVELVIVLVVGGILSVTMPIIVFHGVKTLVYLPKALAVNEAAMEALHQVVEGGFSTLPGQATIEGLRFAVRRSATDPALWLAETSRVGFLSSDGQYVLLRLDAEAIKRSVVAVPACSPTPGTEEVLPYQASGTVRILPTGSLFRYYNQGGTEVQLPPLCPPTSTIRRVDIAFAAQTGSGSFDEGHAKEDITTSVAIRIP